MYLVFDVLVVNGTPFAQEPLTKRLQKINDAVIAPYREGVSNGTIPASHPFSLIGKTFYDKVRLDQEELEQSIYRHGLQCCVF
jgi:hypothetical protein